MSWEYLGSVEYDGIYIGFDNIDIYVRSFEVYYESSISMYYITHTNAKPPLPLISYHCSIDSWMKHFDRLQMKFVQQDDIDDYKRQIYAFITKNNL